jgi:ABC-type transport system substrate-binding protein
MGRRALLLLAALSVGAGLFAATGLGRPVEKGGTLRIGSAHDIDSLDPALAYGIDSWAIEYATCTELYSYLDRAGSAGTTLIPEVAVDFPRVSKDGKTNTIQLNRTYRFDTGAPVTAANFVAAVNRDANSRMQSPVVAAGYLHDIVGADAVSDGKAETVSGVKALGPYTLQIRTTRPATDLLHILALPFFCPVAVGSPPVEMDVPLGSGPYHFVSHVKNRQIVLERNRFYRGPRSANVDRMVWTFQAPETCRQGADRNQLDYCWFVGPENIPGIVAKYGINRPGGRFFLNSSLGIYYFAFNHDRPAFKGVGQIPLKQAINLVLDRHALAQAAGLLTVRRVDQILSGTLGRDVSIYPRNAPTERDVEKARALVAKAKIKPEKLILYAHLPGFKGVNAAWAQIFKFALSRLGIDVETRYFGSFGEVGARAGTRGEPFDVVIGAWTPDYADGAAVFAPLLDGTNLRASGNFNLAYFDRPKVNAEIERIEGLTGEPRHKAWADLDVHLMRDDPPWAPFGSGLVGDFVSRSFGCYVYQPAYSAVDFAAACKK